MTDLLEETIFWFWLIFIVSIVGYGGWRIWGYLRNEIRDDRIGAGIH